MPGQGPYGKGMPDSSHSFKPVQGEPRECGPTTHQQQPAEGPQQSLPNPGPKPTWLRAVQRTGQQEAAPVPFLNLDPVAHLVGYSNGAPVFVDGQRATALIDLGAWILSINSQFCEDLTLQIQPLGRLLELEGRGGSTIQYLGYIEVNLQIPGIKNYDEDVVLLVIPPTNYSEKVLVMVGSKIIDWAMGVITKGELAKENYDLEKGSFLGLSCPGYCSCHTLMEPGWKKGGNSFFPRDWHHIYEGVLSGWYLGPSSHYMDGYYSPIQYCQYTWQYQCQGHCLWVYMLAEPTPGPQLPTSVVLTVTYRELHLGSSQLPICFWNLSAHSIQIPTQSHGWTGHAHQPSTTGGPPRGNLRGSTCRPQQGWLLEALDFQGLGEWPKAEQEEARELLFNWEHLFASIDFNLGRTASIKHQIEVTDWMPFKEHYHCIPPHMYDDVKAHLQECWTLVPSESHTVHGWVQWFWSGRTMAAWGPALTSGS